MTPEDLAKLFHNEYAKQTAIQYGYNTEDYSEVFRWEQESESRQNKWIKVCEVIMNKIRVWNSPNGNSVYKLSELECFIDESPA